jgi:hypothetical protein
MRAGTLGVVEPGWVVRAGTCVYKGDLPAHCTAVKTPQFRRSQENIRKKLKNRIAWENRTTNFDFVN